MRILEGEASEQKVAEELRNWIEEDWDFKVRKLSREEYITAFPDEISVEMFSKFSSVDLALYGLKAKISRTKIGASASSVLQSTWVKIYGIPDFVKEVDIVKEIASLAAEPIKVDAANLKGEGPVRVQANCRDPSKLRGFIKVFFNGIGYELRFVAEGFPGKSSGGQGGPPGQGNKGDGQDKNKKKDDWKGPNSSKPSSSRRTDRFRERDQE